MCSPCCCECYFVLYIFRFDKDVFPDTAWNIPFQLRQDNPKETSIFILATCNGVAARRSIPFLSFTCSLLLLSRLPPISLFRPLSPFQCAPFRCSIIAAFIHFSFRIQSMYSHSQLTTYSSHTLSQCESWVHIFAMRNTMMQSRNCCAVCANNIVYEDWGSAMAKWLLREWITCTHSHCTATAATLRRFLFSISFALHSPVVCVCVVSCGCVFCASERKHTPNSHNCQ